MKKEELNLAAHQAALQASFRAFLGADGAEAGLEASEALRAAALALGLPREAPLWQALRLVTQLQTAKELHEVLRVKQASHPDYANAVCQGLRVVVVGGGPGGLRAAIEAALLGAEVVVLEKRAQVSRHNVLKLWPGVVQDCLSLGLKVFYRQFGTTGSEKVAIRRLQLVLLRVALLLGVRVELGAAFAGLHSPSPEGNGSWRVELEREGCPTEEGGREFLSCDAVIGADGENSRVAQATGFSSHFVQFSKAVGITFNFVHSRQQVAEVQLREFSRSGIYYKGWFEEVAAKTGVLLENLVYFKDETHYFVMAAKPAQLLAAGVLKQPDEDLQRLLSRENVDHLQLCTFAKQIARTVGLPEDVPFALNGAGSPDVAIFDFTKKRSSGESLRILAGEQPLMVGLVGDALMAPFWPLGTGANKAVLGALDAAHALVRFAAARSAPAGERQAAMKSLLADQYAVFQQLRSIDMGGSDALRPNSPDLAPRGTKYSWTLEPASRYARPGDGKKATERTDALYVEQWPLTAAQVPVIAEESPVEQLQMQDVVEAMSHFGEGPAAMPPGLERMMSDMGFQAPGLEGMAEDVVDTMSLFGAGPSLVPSGLQRMMSDMGYEEPVGAQVPGVLPAERKMALVPCDIADFLARHPEVHSLADLLKAASHAGIVA